MDAVYSALKEMGYEEIEVKISETGWPSMGDPEEKGASMENAKAYNGNLLKRIAIKEGTPMKPSVPIDVHLFALFNEDLKPGPRSERNYGLFYPDGTPVYKIGLHGYTEPPPYYFNYDVGSSSSLRMVRLRASNLFYFTSRLADYFCCCYWRLWILRRKVKVLFLACISLLLVFV